MSEYGPEMVVKPDSFIMFDLDALIQQVKDQHVEITFTYEPGRTEMSVQPWRPYTPTCPYARKKQEEIKHAD